MYANLQVTVGDHEPVSAWRVKIVGTQVSVFVDANEDGPRPEPDGVVVVDAEASRAIIIQADF